jgi:nucleotide-binding universal stress UspA family protein
VPDKPALYCYDGSDGSKHALAVAPALLGGGPAVVVCIWRSSMQSIMSVPYASMPVAAIEEADESIKQRAHGLCDEAKEVLGSAHSEVDSRVEETVGSIWATILDAADAVDAGVIVVGSRGLGGVASSLLGSVSHGLANHSKRPLLIVPPA